MIPGARSYPWPSFQPTRVQLSAQKQESAKLSSGILGKWRHLQKEVPGEQCTQAQDLAPRLIRHLKAPWNCFHAQREKGEMRQWFWLLCLFSLTVMQSPFSSWTSGTVFSLRHFGLMNCVVAFWELILSLTGRLAEQSAARDPFAFSIPLSRNGDN